MSSSVPQNTLDSFSVVYSVPVSERKLQIADKIIPLSWYKYFSSRHVEASLPSLTKAMATPPKNCPSMATLAFNTQEDVIENYTVEQFHQAAQSTTYSGTKKKPKSTEIYPLGILAAVR